MKSDPKRINIELSILIVSYNAIQFLDNCLASIKEFLTSTYEVILVDNGSNDGTSRHIRENYPWVKLIRSERNLGFTAGNNLAARAADGKFMLLLNADTKLLTDVQPAIDLLTSDPKIGVVGGLMYRKNGAVGQSTGHFPSAFRLWLIKSLWIRSQVPYGGADQQIFRADWVEGAFLMTSRENWQALGGLDEYYFLCGDDMDFCRATVERGLEVVQCTKIRYIHFGGHTPNRAKFLYGGFRHYHKKFSGPVETVFADVVLRVGLVIRITTFGVLYFLTRRPQTKEKLMGFIDAHRNWAAMTP